MPFLLVPGTSRCELVAVCGLELDPACGCEEDEEPPVACWYEGGASAGVSSLDMFVRASLTRQVKCAVLIAQGDDVWMKAQQVAICRR